MSLKMRSKTPLLAHRLERWCVTFQSMERFGLRDDQWDRIKDFLPGRESHVGGTAADNRRFVDAVPYRYRTGIPWRDLPARFGDGKGP
jgi:transposase